MVDKTMSLQMPSLMSNMMVSNHIMSKFNGNLHGNFSTDSLMSETFISETCGMFLQIFMLSLFSALSAYCTTSMETLKNIFTKFIKKVLRLLLFPFKKSYYLIHRLIYGDQTKYKIMRSCSQYTTEFIRNSDLFEVIQWYLSSDKCEKKKNKEVLTNSKELYLPSQVYINDYDELNIKKLKFGMGNSINEEIVINFDSHEIICTKEKTDIEIKGELQTSKRDNFTYYFETYDVNPDSDIIERLFKLAVIEFNKTKQEWKQNIYHNDGDLWLEPQEITAPNSLKSVVMRDDMKESLENTVEFFLQNPQFYGENGLRRKLVIVNMGPPGTGKTTTAVALANQHKMNIYSLNIDKTTKGDLKNLIDTMDTKKGILLIDDFDHYHSKLGNNVTPSSLSDVDSDTDDSPSKKNRRSKKSVRKEPISYHELLTVFDGTGSKDGLIIFVNLNDPSKIFKSTKIEDLALFRDRRVNLFVTFEYCDHKMIKDLYYNIFKKYPNQKLIDAIPEDQYAPCVIAQQFIELYERYSKVIDSKQKEIDQILIDLASNTIKTSQDKIKDYLKKLEFYNKEKVQ